MNLEELKESRIVWYGLSTVLIVGLIYTADFREFIQSLSQVNRFYISLALISGLSVFLVWGYVWHSFFREMEIEKDIVESYKLFMAGNFMNSVTPLGQIGGEPFMAYVISENTDSSYEKALSAVISSDLINAIPILSYASLGILYFTITGGKSNILTQGIILFAGFGLAILTSAYLLWSSGNRFEKVLLNLIVRIQERFERADRAFEYIKQMVRDLNKAFEKAGENKSHLLKVTAISHLWHPTQFICLYLILIGLSVEPSIAGIVLTVVFSSLAAFSPTPGGAGTFEAAFSGLLIVFFPNIGLDGAVAAAVLFRMTTYWPGIPIGYFSLLSLRRGD